MKAFYQIGEFYDLKTKQFFKDALNLSYAYNIDNKDGWQRINTQKYTFADMLDMIDKYDNNHYTCINRKKQSPTINVTHDAEVGFCTMGAGEDVFLFIYLTEENLGKLIKQYNLKYLNE